MAGVKGKTLEEVSWYLSGGRGRLWAMLAPGGKEAMRSTPLEALAVLNIAGRTAADVIGRLSTDRSVCVDRIERIQAETTRVGGKCATVEKALKAVKEDQNTKLTAYSRAVGDTKIARGEIQVVQSEIETEFKRLENAKKQLEKFNVDSRLDKTEEERQAVKASRDATIASVKEFLDLAKLAMKRDLLGVADMAIRKIAIGIVEVDYEPELKALTKKIEDLKKKSAELAKEIVVGELVTAASQFKTKVKKLNKVTVPSFNISLGRAAQARKQAMDSLDKRPTKALADIMRDRRVHMTRIGNAMRDIAKYKADLEKAMKQMNGISRDYYPIKNILKMAAKKDESYAPGSAYGKAVDKWGRDNSKLLGDWTTHARSEVAYCKKEYKYLNDSGAQGPFAGFNKIQKMIDKALETSRKDLRAHGLKC